MKEQACQFGESGRLSGVVTLPSGMATDIACVLVTAGLVPKAGPYRLYALIAREIAQQGVKVLRFDLGGVGDSEPDGRTDTLRNRTSGDIRHAVDYAVQQLDAKRIVLCGLCSGAEDSFRYAENDERVVGVAMIDPFAYETAGTRWRFQVHRIVRRTLRLLGIYAPLDYSKGGGASIVRAGDGGSLIKYKYIEPAESKRILDRLLGRAVHVHFIYTGAVKPTFNHPDQLEQMFEGMDFQGRVALTYLPRLEHTQILHEDRTRMVTAISQWLRSKVLA